MSVNGERVLDFLGAEVAEQVKRIAMLLAENEYLSSRNKYLEAQLSQVTARADRLAASVPPPPPPTPQPAEPVRINGETVKVD